MHVSGSQLIIRLVNSVDQGVYTCQVVSLSEYQCKWEVFPLMGVYILIGVYATPLMRGVIITYE